jgi:predicted enzyme related to lactoylglutathione lyase
MNLNSVLIGSEDPKPLVEYYSQVFGPPSFEGGDFRGWQIGTGFLTIGPHDKVKGKNAHPGRVIWNIETPDVRAEFERLVAAGATVVQEPYDPNREDEALPEMLIATFSDPDGNYFQLLSPMSM